MDHKTRQDEIRFHGFSPEIVKRLLRFRFGTLTAFHEHFGLPKQATSDVLRGRPSQRTVDAIEEVISEIMAAEPSSAFLPGHSLIEERQ